MPPGHGSVDVGEGANAAPELAGAAAVSPLNARPTPIACMVQGNLVRGLQHAQHPLGKHCRQGLAGWLQLYIFKRSLPCIQPCLVCTAIKVWWDHHLQKAV
jgi:hypothetical protein